MQIFLTRSRVELFRFTCKRASVARRFEFNQIRLIESNEEVWVTEKLSLSHSVNFPASVIRQDLQGMRN